MHVSASSLNTLHFSLPCVNWVHRYTYDDEYSEFGSEDEPEYIGDWKVSAPPVEV